MGVHTTSQGQGVGNRAVGFVVLLARSVSEMIGCRYVVLDPQPDLVDWYAGLGFVRNRKWQEERVREAVKHGRDPALVPVSMRLDLRETADAGASRDSEACGGLERHDRPPLLIGAEARSGKRTRVSMAAAPRLSYRNGPKDTPERRATVARARAMRPLITRLRQRRRER